MTKVKLVNGIIINADTIELNNGILKITTADLTVEELASLFSNKENTNYITLMTESEIETGCKTGFTSFAGINYNTEGIKTIELFQPIDVTEARLSNVEGMINGVDCSMNNIEASINSLFGLEV